MNLRQIEAFRCVMLRGSMTIAATELKTSQPSISRLISELEADIKFRVFERKAGRLYPTEEGLAFFREVELSFKGLKSLERIADDIRFSGNARLRIAAIPSMSFGFISKIIADFRRVFPDVSITLEMNGSATIMQWLLYGDCDIGFVSSILESPSVEVYPLYRYAGLCALPAHHRLAKLKTIKPGDLNGECFIPLSWDNGQRGQLERVFKAAGMPTSFSLEARYGATICALVEQGLGVGIVNPITAYDYRHAGIVFRPFKPEIYFHGTLLLSQHKRKSVLIDQFVAIAQNEVMVATYNIGK